MKKLKEFLRIFNIFELDFSSRSYKSPIIRMAVSILIIACICAFRLNVTITSIPLNVFLSILIFAVMIMCVLCFFIAMVECLQVGDNRKKDKARENNKRRF